MAEAEKKTRRTEPSDAECFILKTFLDSIYADRDALNRHNPWKSDLPGMDNNPRLRFSPTWTNTPGELYEQYCEQCTADKGFDQYGKDTFYKTLKKLEMKGILRKTTNDERATKESRYYPVETSEGYLNLIAHVTEHYRSGFYPNKRFGLDPLYSKYSEIVLNRQFILDCLKNKADSIRMIRGDRLIDIPFLGRYRKNSDLRPRIDSAIETLERIRTVIKKMSVIDYRLVRRLLFYSDEPIPGTQLDLDHFGINKEKTQTDLKFLDNLIQAFRLESDFMKKTLSSSERSKDDVESMRGSSDRTFKTHADHLKEISPGLNFISDNGSEIHGIGWYKQESTWERIILSEEETKELESIDEGFSNEYVEWIDDSIIMPLLCLCQFSPSALLYLTDDSIEPKDRRFTFSLRMDHLFEHQAVTEQIPDDLIPFISSYPKSFNGLLGDLTKKAVSDYLDGKGRIIDGNIHDKLTRTRLISFGYSDMRFYKEKESNSFPALFTFRVFKDHTVSIIVSECPNYDQKRDDVNHVEDYPRPVLFDWGPAMGYTECNVSSPSSRLYEIFRYITHTIETDECCLSHLIEEAILDGVL